MTDDEIRQHIEMLLADSEVLHRKIELLFESVTQFSESAKADRHAAKSDRDSEWNKITGLIEGTQELAKVTSNLLRIAESRESRLPTIEGNQ